MGADSAPSESLTVRDNRTGKVYNVPYVISNQSRSIHLAEVYCYVLGFVVWGIKDHE